MNAIEAVSSIEQVLKSARVQKDLPVDDALAQKFASLMQPVSGADASTRPDFHAPAVGHGTNAVTDVMAKHEAAMRCAFDDAHAVAANASSMSMNELVAANIDVSQRMVMANVGMQSVTAMGQTTNKSLQSLLKNQ
jgi:hypothetical protein